jgi:hypothetical protein
MMGFRYLVEEHIKNGCDDVNVPKRNLEVEPFVAR